jgi:CBS domain-containing protein
VEDGGSEMLIEHILANKGSEVISVPSTATVAEAVDVLRARRIGAVVVTDDGTTAAGILSERDVVRLLADTGPSALTRPVTTAMTTSVHTCAPEATLDELMAIMTTHRIRHLPVVRDGEMVGVVSIGDVVKLRVVELSQEAQALHDYVHSGR